MSRLVTFNASEQRLEFAAEADVLAMALDAGTTLGALEKEKREGPQWRADLQEWLDTWNADHLEELWNSARSKATSICPRSGCRLPPIILLVGGDALADDNYDALF